MKKLLFALMLVPYAAIADDVPDVAPAGLIDVAELEREVWGAVNLTSYHFSEQQFNQNNIGAGVEYHFDSDLLVLGGKYKNSVGGKSTYALAGWTPLHYGAFHAGLAVGAVNGYPALNNGKLAPVAVGLIRAEGERFGANLIVIPAAKGSPLTIGLQLKMKF